MRQRDKQAPQCAEAYALANALRDIGEPHLAAAALICFEWHQRPEHVRAGDITWADYRPPHRPDVVHVRHPKTGEKGWVPLEDDEGPLFPELEAFLAELPRIGIPIVLTAGVRGPARPYSSEYAQRCVREARVKAELGSHVTLDACRHDGLSELGDAGATEFEGMSASMHKSPQALRLYVKRIRDPARFGRQKTAQAHREVGQLRTKRDAFVEWNARRLCGMASDEPEILLESWRSLRESNPSFQIEKRL